MKLKLLLPALVFSLCGFSLDTDAQNTREAVEYMGKIYEPYDRLNKETWQYLKAITRGKGARKVEKTRLALIAQIKTTESSTRRTGDFEGDATLMNGIMEYMKVATIVLKEDFEKILDMEEIAEQSYDNMEAYLTAKELASERLDAAAEVATQAQKTFAASYGIEMREGADDKTTQKIERAGEALSYYNDLYLMFFKCYKQEAYVLEAQGRNDVSAMQQNINQLKADSEATLAKLKTMKPFKGDGALKFGCIEMIRFYENEAEKDFAKVMDFYIKKDNFEKSKQVMESKSKKDRTQEDVDNYNNAINEFNEAVGSYNEINDAMNKKRSDALNNWNKRVDKFFDTHS